MNYEKDIEIDESALDVEWLEQPSLLMKYIRNAANCRKQVDLMKEKLDFTKAELDSKIRKSPERYKIEKITEGAITSCILMQETFKEINEEYLQAKHELDIAQGAVNAIHQRKDALENLTRLYGLQYFAGPSISRDITQEREKRKEKINSKISERLNKKPRFV